MKKGKRSVFLFCILLKTVTSSFCYWNSGCSYKYFSSKTPYSNVRGDIRDSIVKLKGCEPISIWALLTNGKSTPEDDSLKNINESLIIRDHVISSGKLGKSSLCAQDIENLQNWSDNNLLSKSNFLTDEGSQEIIGIASRLRHAFPKLLQNLRDGNYKISPATGGLLDECADNFIKGLQNAHLTLDRGDDDVIATHKICAKYQDLLIDSNTYSQVNKFKKTPDYLAMKDRIQRRLGIEYPLSDDSVKSLYDLCRYTWSGIENKFSPWCALFTTEDLRVLEYIGDLEHYYKNGYGTTINKLLGRIPMSDLFRKFQEAIDGKGKNVVAYFSDSAILEMIATALDLFKDDTPLSASRNPKRKWRTSKLSVFSANLIAVLNRCGKDNDTDHNVVFYWNEEPLLPICEKGFCSWDEFQYKLLPFLNSTTEFCNK